MVSSIPADASAGKADAQARLAPALLAEGRLVQARTPAFYADHFTRKKMD